VSCRPIFIVGLTVTVCKLRSDRINDANAAAAAAANDDDGWPTDEGVAFGLRVDDVSVRHIPDGHWRRRCVERHVVGLAHDDVGKLLENGFDVETLGARHVRRRQLTVDHQLQPCRLAERQSEVCPRVDGQVERCLPETCADSDADLVFRAVVVLNVLTHVDAI